MPLYPFQSIKPHLFESNPRATLGKVATAVLIYHCVKLRPNTDQLFTTFLIPHKPFFLVDMLSFVGEGSEILLKDTLVDQHYSPSRGYGWQDSWVGGKLGFWGQGR